MEGSATEYTNKILMQDDNKFLSISLLASLWKFADIAKV